MSSQTITTRLLLFVPRVLHDPKCPNYPKPLGLWQYGIPKVVQDLVHQQYCCNKNHKDNLSNRIHSRNSDNNTAAAVVVIIIMVVVIAIVRIIEVVTVVIIVPKGLRTQIIGF